MDTSNIDEKLNQILKKSQTPSEHHFLPDELSSLTSAFVPTHPESSQVRPKAYVVLSAVCQGARNTAGKGKDSEATTTLVKIFAPPVVQLFGETDEKSLLAGACFLTALFQVDAATASAIFVRDGLVENLMDSVDLAPSPLLSQEVAHLLGHSCGHKACRATLTPQIIRWLEFKSRQSTDVDLQSAASVTLIKLSKGAATDAPENGTPEVQHGQTEDLARILTEIVVAGRGLSIIDAVEGLAYVSTDPSLKEKLARNSAFLKQLFMLIPSQKSSSKPSDRNPTLVYGVVAIISNLTSFRPRLSEEQKQVEKLKRMTKAAHESGDAADKSSLLDDDDHVKARIRLLVAAGVLPVFPAALASSDSAGVRLGVGKALLSIVEEKENRGKVLQSGGAKALQIIIKHAQSTQSEASKDKQSTLDAVHLDPIQALAKLAITSSPVQVFGPSVGAMYDAVRPLSILLQHTSSNLLQRFEAIMSLTNLASHSPEMASRIAKADGLVNKVELLLLEDHTLVRRASVELICNLIAGSDDVFNRYSGDSPNSASKIHVLLALSDVEDVSTRLASSGALATLTAAPSACHALIKLQFERNRFLPIMTQLIDPSMLPKSEPADEVHVLETDPGLVHRGAVCVANVFKNISDAQTRERISKEGKESGLLPALVNLAKGQGVMKDPAIMHQAAEALKALIR